MFEKCLVVSWWCIGNFFLLKDIWFCEWLYEVYNKEIIRCM